MKKYILKRVGLSLLSLLVVIFIVMILIYNLMDRNKILRSDELYNKSRYNEKEVVKYTIFQNYGYLSYESAYNSDIYKNATEEEQAAIAKNIRTGKTEADLKNEKLQQIIQSFNSRGYKTVYLPTVYNSSSVVLSNAQLLFVNDLNVFQRMGSFFSNLFRFETIYDVKDDSLTDRYIRLEWDKNSNMPALVGSGTRHKYLVYFDNKFPFVHQNIFHINLGTSHILSNGNDVVEYMKTYIGDVSEQNLYAPKDFNNPDAEKVSTIYDFHSATYSSSPTTADTSHYFEIGEHYNNVISYQGGVSRIGISFILGIIAILLAYIIGLPIGIWMAQKKDKLVDQLGNIYIIFIMSVPSLAYIYMLATIGRTAFGFPLKYSLATGNKVLAFIMPTISLALPSIAGLMKWMRRYMIDQQNSDYVKFARSQGLSEGEIFSKHISKNAFIFLVHSIPADILGALVGAIITESVYGVPGIGGMLTESISRSDNAVIVGVTVFYTTLTIVSLIAGDLLLAKYDPRISLSSERN